MEKPKPIAFVQLSENRPDIWEQFSLRDYYWVYELIEALNEHTPWLAEHSLRVGYLCYHLGQLVGLDKPETTVLVTSGFLHDVGKLKLNPEILNHYQAEGDRSVFKSHVMDGYNMLRSLSSVEAHKAADIMKVHHKFQRESYPDEVGLEPGTRLYQQQALLAIADATDALLTDRPYQQAKSASETWNILNWRFADDFRIDIVQNAIEARQNLSL